MKNIPHYTEEYSSGTSTQTGMLIFAWQPFCSASIAFALRNNTSILNLYDEFNGAHSHHVGFGRNASDINRLYALAWLM